MSRRMLVSVACVLLVALALPAVAGATAAPFPHYRYKLASLRLTTKAAWDQTTDTTHTWGSEQATATASRVGQINAWNWSVPMKGPLVGDYHYTDIWNDNETCGSTNDIGPWSTKALANIVPMSRDRVKVAMGMTISQSAAGVETLHEQLRQQCEGAGSIYNSKALDAGWLQSTNSAGRTSGACNGYTQPCIIVPRSRFTQARVLLTVPGTYTYTDMSGIPYTWTQTWTLDLRRYAVCRAVCSG